jgi:hypothetical protein
MITLHNPTLTINYRYLVNYYITGPTTVNSGATAQYTATGVYDDGSTVDLTNTNGWAWAGEIQNISSSGLLTAYTVGAPAAGTVYFSYGVVADVPNGYVSYPITVVPPSVAITVQTNPSGRSFTVDGTSYTSLQTFSWMSGSNHTIATTSPQNGGTGIQYVWSGWNDGGGMSHTVAPTVATTYTANFNKQYYLTMKMGTGGSSVSPGSSWYNSGAGVSIGTTPANGYSFSSWTGSGSGSYSGSNNPASVTMNGPITETANFSQQTWCLEIQEPQGSGTTEPATDDYYYLVGSSSASITATPASGWTFSYWTGSAVSGQPTTNPITISSGTAGQTLTLQAVFEQNPQNWTLQIQAPTGSGSTNPGTGSYAYPVGNSSTPIQATAASGWTFSYWTGSAVSGQPTTNPITISSGTTGQTKTL